jgi:optic atrophy 3 protein
MRLRLGLLQDPAAIDRQIERELKEAEAKRKKDAMPTVKTEAETKADEEARKRERQQVKEHVKAQQKPPRIRPLSEAKAIETGANFISETFLFLVAAGAVVFESWRSRRKESNRREGIDDRLEDLEKERAEMRAMIDLLQSEITAATKQKPIATTQAVLEPPPNLKSSNST